MSFRLAPKSVTLNGVMALILRYFAKFLCTISSQKQLLHVPRFQNLVLIVYDHIKIICVIMQQLFGQNKLISRFDGRRCIDD